MATECICRAVQIQFPGIARIPWGSCSGNLGGKEVASTQEEHEGTGEVPKPSRAVRRRSTEAAPGRFGISGLVWGSQGWLVPGGPRKGQVWDAVWFRVCRAGSGGSGGVRALWGDVCDVSPRDWVGVFCFCLSPHLPLVSLQLCNSEPWLLHISV